MHVNDTVLRSLRLRQLPRRACVAPGRRAAVPVAVIGVRLRPADADPVVATVDGTEIRASDLAIAEEEVGSNLPSRCRPKPSANISSPT